jgi:sugar O-acyltransferase (sialic acid O-acetyltransferase NeuD family)
MQKILIIGSSGHAKVVIDIIEKEGRFQIIGLLDRFRAREELTLGYPVLGSEEDLPQLITQYSITGVLIAIGDNFIRSEVARQITNSFPGLEFITTIHPSACIARDVSIGRGSVIMAGVSVNPCCAIGDFCILNTQSSLDHDSILDDYSSLAPYSVTGGNCRIGAYSAIGIGAVLINGIEIAAHTLVGAGSTVLQSIGSYAVAYGTPAKIIRSRKAGDKYL